MTTAGENTEAIVVVILTHNQARGHSKGSSHSAAEEYLMEKHKQKVVNAYITANAIHASTRNIQE